MALATKHDERNIRRITSATWTDNELVLGGMIQEFLFQKDNDMAESFMRKWLDERAAHRGEEYPGTSRPAQAAA